MPVAQISCASRWSLPIRLASACSTGAEMPSDLGTFTPKYAIFARTLGFASLLSSRSTADFVHCTAFFCVRGRLKCFVGIEEDCDRTFIHQLHGHHRLENSGCHGNAEFAKRFAEFVVQRFGLLRRRRGDEAWPPLSARIAV